MPSKIDILRTKTRERFKEMFGHEYFTNRNDINDIYKSSYHDENTDGYCGAYCPNEMSDDNEVNLLIIFLCDDRKNFDVLMKNTIINIKDEYNEAYIYFMVSFLDASNNARLCYTKLFSHDLKTYFVKENDPIITVFREFDKNKIVSHEHE